MIDPPLDIDPGHALAQPTLACRQGNTGEDAFQASLTALGFQPQTQDREDERTTVRLRNCPTGTPFARTSP